MSYTKYGKTLDDMRTADIATMRASNVLMTGVSGHVEALGLSTGNKFLVTGKAHGIRREYSSLVAAEADLNARWGSTHIWHLTSTGRKLVFSR